MRKKFAIAAAVAAAFGIFGPVGAAQARCETGKSAGGSVLITLPGTGSDVYTYSNNNATAPKGFVGVSGSTGYIEAGGDFTAQSGYIKGATTNGSPVNGQISGSAAGGPKVCVNDVRPLG
jgi:hypothetical protein